MLESSLASLNAWEAPTSQLADIENPLALSRCSESKQQGQQEFQGEGSEALHHGNNGFTESANPPKQHLQDHYPIALVEVQDSQSHEAVVV